MSPVTENDSIKLTKHQSAAIQRNIAEIQQIQQMFNLKAEADKRMTDMLVLDGGFDPANYSQYEIREKDGVQYLFLIPKPAEV